MFLWAVASPGFIVRKGGKWTSEFGVQIYGLERVPSNGSRPAARGKGLGLHGELHIELGNLLPRELGSFCPAKAGVCCSVCVTRIRP